MYSLGEVYLSVRCARVYVFAESERKMSIHSISEKVFHLFGLYYLTTIFSFSFSFSVSYRKKFHRKIFNAGDKKRKRRKKENDVNVKGNDNAL